jgi:elongation factor G
METKDLRNVALISHGGAGKTSLADAFLFDAKVNTRLGSVDEGTSLLDFEPEELKRKKTLSSSLHHFTWEKSNVNIIDTPGDANFSADVQNCLQVVDAAIVAIDAVSGVQVQTEKVWKYADNFNLPRVIFINKVDMERSNFAQTIKGIEESLGKKPLVIQLPLGEESSFQGVIDLIRMKAVKFSDDSSGDFTEEDIPDDMRAQAEEFNSKMIEDIAESSDELLEKYLEGTALTPDEISNGLKQGVISGSLVPVLCGAASKNMGIQPLLNFIVNCFPSPLDRQSFKGINPSTEKEEERSAAKDDPLSALVFKTVADPYAGRLTIFRVVSGVLNSDSTVYNTTTSAKERIGQILKIEGKNQKATNPAITGDLVAVAKLKTTTTGNTFCDEKHPITFTQLQLPEPVMQLALEPKSKGDEDKLISSLARLMEEDSTLKTIRDKQTKEFILAGMGQTHLDVAIEKMQRKFGVNVEVKTPKVAYKETVRSSAKGQGKLKKQSGGRGQFADTWLEIEPMPKGKGFEFVSKIVGGAIPRQYIPSVEKGVKEAMLEGVLAKYPVSDIKVTLYDGSFHDVDSSDIAFKIAASMGFRKIMQEAKPILLEPIMNVEVTVPDECMGDVIGDLNGRRGRIAGMEPKINYQVVKAHVPMSELLKYASELTAITGGRGSFSMEFANYEEIPNQLSEKIIAQRKAELGIEE